MAGGRGEVPRGRALLIILSITHGFPPPLLSSSFPLNPQTVDNWGTYATQCAVPGYGAPSLFIYNNNVQAPTSYPVTYDQKAACNLNVFTSNLVDKANSTIIYGKVREAFIKYGSALSQSIALHGICGSGSWM